MPIKRSVKRHSVTQPSNESYRIIPLTQGQIAIVSFSDYDWLNKFNWCAEWHPKKKKFYAARNGGKKMIWMHRFILGLKDGELGDHKNGLTLDNRRDNLRKCDFIQNACNRGPQSNNKSGYKGVCFHKNKWRATINFRGMQTHIGTFATAKEASLAYDMAAMNIHGDFAKFNHTLEPPRRKL